MTPFPVVVLLLAAPPAPPVRIAVAQLTIRQQVIVRVPARVTATPRIAWREKKGPRCAPMGDLAGAVVTERDSVDLVLRGGGRLRAEFAASCPALSFYSGFYILPTEDRRICADRDSIHDRSGGECEIERFRRLEPVAAASSPSPATRRTRGDKRVPP